MVERQHTLSIRLSSEELAKVHELARLADLSIGQMLRKYIRAQYSENCGEAAPPTIVPRRGPRRRAAK